MGRHLERQRAGSPPRAAAVAGPVPAARRAQRPGDGPGTRGRRDATALLDARSTGYYGAEPETPQEKDLLALYIRQIAHYSLLTGQDEQSIGEGMHARRVELAGLEKKAAALRVSRKAYLRRKAELEHEIGQLKNRLILGNLRLVVSVAKKYQHRGVSLLDLVDEGNIGLIEAVERFDYRKGCRFSTYGTWWIKQAVIKALAENGKAIKIPIHLLNTIRKCFSIARQLTQELGREPTNAEIADYLRMPKGRVEELISLSWDPTSLDSPIAGENPTHLSDLIRDDASSKPFDGAFALALQDTIAMVLDRLSEREMRIIKLRFGLDGEGPFTLEETGRILGITRERVRQIQERAIVKLKQLRVSSELEAFTEG
jgi:RNA polymerase primary sigma factor